MLEGGSRDADAGLVIEAAIRFLGEHRGLSAREILSLQVANPDHAGMLFFVPPKDAYIPLRVFLTRRRAQLCRLVCEDRRPKPWATASASVGAQALVPLASGLLAAGWTVDMARLAVVGLTAWGISRFCKSCR